MAARAVKRLAGNGTGQSLADRMTSMKHSIAGSLIAKTICKATTEEMNAPKRKHLNILVNCTYEPRLSMPEFTNYIIGRSHNSSWVVSFKALITIHHLMNCGSERFSQYLASNNCQLSTPRPFEKCTSQAATMFLFIRHYSRYLDARCASYREVAFDFCKIKRKTDDVNMKTMPQVKLFKVLPPLERQIDALLAFEASSSELFNSVVLAAYVLLYKDLIRLYAVYNEGMINIIEKFFSMSKKDCQESLRIYKAFLKRMEYVNQFIKVAEACDSLHLQDGFGKQSLIFKPVPTSVLDALESHLAHLEGKKPTELGKTSPTLSSPSTNKSVTRDLVLLQDIPNHRNLSVEQQRIIEEERQRLEAFVSQARAKCANTTPEHASSAVERSSSDGDLLQLFSPDPTSGSAPTATSKIAPSTDLFDDFFFEPAMTTSNSHMALSTVPSAQPRTLTQFLSEPSSIPTISNPNNPFLPVNSSAWPPPSAAENTSAEKATNNKTEVDLDSRLAEIAEQLSVSNLNTTTTATTVNWTGTVKSQQQRQQTLPLSSSTAISTMNPWVTPGGVLQPTPMLKSTSRSPLQSVYHPQSRYALSQYPADVMSVNQIPTFAQCSTNTPTIYSTLQSQQQAPHTLQFQSTVTSPPTTTSNPLNPFL